LASFFSISSALELYLNPVEALFRGRLIVMIKQEVVDCTFEDFNEMIDGIAKV